MPFISEAASAIKSRFGFHDPSESARATPDFIAKSASRENLSQFSAIRSYNDRDDESRDANSNSAIVVRSFELSEDPSFWKDHNVQVIIRLRPLSSSEISLQGHNRCVKQESHQTLTWIGHPESRFTFDLVADETVSQEKLFKVAGVPMVENCVGGYNSCMFAYGQTGSGKTHTMLGDIEGGTRRHSVNCGMTPRVFEFLFSRIQKEKEARREDKLQFTCKCSFLEIYNEQILDLLNPSSSNLQMREDSKKGVYVENLTELEVTNATEVMQQLLEGATNRKVAATNMNRASSRSHSVFTCAIESTWQSQGVTHHRFARLNLVDLAGSERQKSSGAEGERLKEATNINKSLSTLGLVIMNLVSISNGKSLHVPYRDSKLTFLLQDSLGGNSKTIIIANISPSTCCSLETLSTLKFAQRAKFIKNNAIVNEDASGDVLAMRMQIQQLKKEVSRLQSLVNGGAGNPDYDSFSTGFLGSPGTFMWEGVRGCLTPLTSDKRMSQKEYEVALVGAFRREKDKDLALQALTAENQAAMRLAKQREDEIQGLKMRLRFREAGIKRLEVVASGKVSAESYLIKEKEEHLKEIEVLRGQVDRNQEVTRFAMENLRLKEEIRRLKSFCEEGEKERMNEQIEALQNKLLEALDWKLMHESEASTVRKASPSLVNGDASNLNTVTPIKDQGSPWLSSVNEENEFLRVQAIQNQAEIDSLQKKLNLCMEETQKLERHVIELEEIRSSEPLKVDAQKAETSLPSARIDDMENISLNDQMELKAIVDAIAAASHREAEAHEMTIALSKENDELKTKLKVLIEDNNKLIDLYERAAAEKNMTSHDEDSEDVKDERENNSSNLNADEKSSAQKKIEDIELQLSEMHEENEKLMGLYEKAMQERDEFKRMLSPGRHHNVEGKVETDCPEKLVEVDAGECSKPDGLVTSSGATAALVEPNSCDEVETCNDYRLKMQEESSQYMQDIKVPIELDSDEYDGGSIEANISTDAMLNAECVGTDTEIKVKDKLSAVRMVLDKAQEKLSISAISISKLGLLECAVLEADELSREIEAVKDIIQAKQLEYKSLERISLETQGREAILEKKFSALKFSVSSLSSSVPYFEQRKARARARLDGSTSYLEQQKDKLCVLQVHKCEMDSALWDTLEAEFEAGIYLTFVEGKLAEEIRRIERKKVLIAIDNVERTELHAEHSIWKFGGKATELLKSEEEIPRLQKELKKSQEKLGGMKRKRNDLNEKSQKLETEIQSVGLVVQKASDTVEERQLALQNANHEIEVLLELREKGMGEIDNVIADFHQLVFEKYLKEEEVKLVEADIKTLLTKLVFFQTEKAAVLKSLTELVHGRGYQPCFSTEMLQQELEDVKMSIFDAKSQLEF